MSIDEVMTATGASRLQIYHYFENKNALVEAVIEFKTGRIIDAATAHFGQFEPHAALCSWRCMMVAAARYR